MNTEQLGQELIELISKDRELLDSVKGALIKSENYTHAAFLRSIESKIWPETEGEFLSFTEAKEMAKQASLALRMVDINVSDMHTLYRIYRAMDALFSMDEDFDTITAVSITQAADKLFGGRDD